MAAMGMLCHPDSLEVVHVQADVEIVATHCSFTVPHMKHTMNDSDSLVNKKNSSFKWSHVD